jgi:hypothetical protein
VSIRDTLVEAAASAWRARDPDGSIRPSGAWLDLDASGRTDAHDAAAHARVLEAALDPEGLTTTARAVLARIRGDAAPAPGEDGWF